MMFKALFFIAILLVSTSAQAKVTDACLNTEHWSADASAPNWLHEFQDFTSGRSSPIYGFAQAVKLKRMSQIMNHSEYEHDFAEYWVARVLFDLKLDPLAHQALASVFENSENKDLKKAAFSCLARIQMRSPDWRAPSVQNLKGLTFTEEDSDILFEPLLGKESKLSETLSPGHKGFIDGVRALSQKDYPEAIVSFQAYFKYLELHSSPVLLKYVDQGHLFLGRALYSVAKFTESANEFQKVKKTSNHQIEALSNLSWAYLLNEKYDDAIGVSLQLRSGNLKNAFAPEPVMVAAMALNELCNYPDSIRMIQAFIKDYQSSFEWLNQNKGESNLYALTVNTLKHQSTVPVKLSSEWIRSPDFLTRQTEMNSLIETPKTMNNIQKNASLEQSRLTKEFLTQAAAFIKDYRIAKLRLKPGEELDSDYSARYQVLKKNLRKLSHFYKASKVFKAMAQVYQRKVPSMKQELVKRVNHDLGEKNKKMLGLLYKVKDNVDLIEVEIYNGASQDLVWKDAHPGFEKSAQALEDQKTGPDNSQTWNWGRFLASNIENAEVWEDELGALKADVVNQCNQKEKFLKVGALKR